MPSVIDPVDWIESAARNQPRRIFLETPAGREIDYASLRAESGRFAAALLRLGVLPGDRVAVQVDKSPEAVLLYLACLRTGAVFVPINVANTPNEVEYFLRDAEPKLAVIRPAARASVEPRAAQAGVPHVETLGAEGEGSLAALVRQCQEALPPRMTPGADGEGSQPALAPPFQDPPPPWRGDANSPAAIVYTSGTTGRSKGAVLSRANLASNAVALAEAWRFSGGDVLLHVLPLFHVHGLFAAINTVLASASSLRLLPAFDAAAALGQLPRVTVFMGVPTHYTRLLQQTGLNRDSTAGVRLFVSGSAPLLAETHQEFLRRTGHSILERYGMTETLMNTSNPYDGARKAGSVGLPLPRIAVRLAGGAAGAAEPSADAVGAPEADAVGALEIRGPNVFSGYWRDAEKTHGEFTADGWFKTGDLGRMDADGYLYIVGRAKDLVISGGYNVYPKEVEMELDALAGVLESAVFGVPHPDFGEGVTAVVVPKPASVLSEAGIIESVQARLARYKVPKRVLFIDELPRNAMSKVQKNQLRTMYASLYGVDKPPER
jgi:malonyl-CoA/methylmalonyl-CoA synthetase